MGRRAAEVNIVFASDAAIKSLNRTYLGIDAPTDVIAFHERGVKWPSLSKAGNSFAGEIVISSDTAKRNAAAYGVTFEKEIMLLVIHGTLHLMGLEDYSAKGRARMRRKENGFLQKAERFSR